MFCRFNIKRFVAIALTTACLMATAAQGASIYVYVDRNGNKLITDHRKPDLPGYRLEKKYHADDNFGNPNRPKSDAGNSSFYQTRISSYDKLIIAKARQLGLEPALLKAIIHIESAFNPDAVSPKGATGLMQLMPETARRYGVQNRNNPSESLEAGGRYIRDLLLLFNDDTKLALAAYNAGENAVKRHNGIPPYNETVHYVRKVIRMRDLYRKEMVGA